MREEDEWEWEFDGFWVDYLEGELDEKLQGDLRELLKISKESRQTLKNFHWLRELVETVDPAHDEHLKKWDANACKNEIMATCKGIDELKQKQIGSWP